MLYLLTTVGYWLAVPVLGVLCVYLLMKVLQARKALLAVALAVEENGSKELKDKIGAIADSLNVKTWLKNFVNKKVSDGKAKDLLNQLLG